MLRETVEEDWETGRAKVKAEESRRSCHGWVQLRWKFRWQERGRLKIWVPRCWLAGNGMELQSELSSWPALGAYGRGGVTTDVKLEQLTPTRDHPGLSCEPAATASAFTKGRQVS